MRQTDIVARSFVPQQSMIPLLSSRCQAPSYARRDENQPCILCTCFTQNRSLPCGASVRSTPGHVVETAFGDVLRRYRLSDSWRTELIHLLEEQTTSAYWEEIEQRRQQLELDKKRLNVMLRAGGIEIDEYEREMQGVNARLAQPPRPEERERYKERALEAGTILASLSERWDAAQESKHLPLMGEYVKNLLRAGGLVWDAEKRAIQAIRPHPEFVPVLLLAMGTEWHEEGEYLVCDQPVGWRKDEKHWSISADQRQRVAQLHDQGCSVREIAETLGIGRMTIQRFLQWQENSEALILFSIPRSLVASLLPVRDTACDYTQNQRGSYPGGDTCHIQQQLRSNKPRSLQTRPTLLLSASWHHLSGRLVRSHKAANWVQRQQRCWSERNR